MKKYELEYGGQFFILTGNYKGYRECHINPDRLLIYKKKEAIKVVSLSRTGTHSDLFKK